MEHIDVLNKTLELIDCFLIGRNIEEEPQEDGNVNINQTNLGLVGNDEHIETVSYFGYKKSIKQFDYAISDTSLKLIDVPGWDHKYQFQINNSIIFITKNTSEYNLVITSSATTGYFGGGSNSFHYELSSRNHVGVKTLFLKVHETLNMCIPGFINNSDKVLEKMKGYTIYNRSKKIKDLNDE